MDLGLIIAIVIGAIVIAWAFRRPSPNNNDRSSDNYSSGYDSGGGGGGD